MTRLTPTSPRPTKAISVALALLLPMAMAAPARAQAETGDNGSLLLGAGAADRSGLVGHAGWLSPPIRKVPVAFRLDGLAGRVGGQSVGAASVSVEVAPRLAAIREGSAGGGLFLFAAVGPAVTWRGPARDVGGVIAVGTRIGTGALTLSAEQRFQQHFSPFVVGVAFRP